MKILSIDTASDVCGVSILEDTNLIIRDDSNTGRTHSEFLMPKIKSCFEKAHLSLSDIDLLVCDIGPGSFTGIRIGVATAKAFQDSINIPTVGISSLEALAYNVKVEGPIASIIDCKNGNCYFALYELKDGIYKNLIPPVATKIDTCHAILQVKHLPVTIAEGELNSYNLGLAGLNKYTSSDYQLQPLLPLYLRKPQAQRQRKTDFEIHDLSTSNYNLLNQISENFNTEFDEFWNFETLLDDAKSENSHYVLALNSGKIIGFAGIKLSLDSADVMNIAVKKEFRNSGIATELLQNLINYCKNHHIKNIFLEVNEKNFPAINLYSKLGFKFIGIRKKFYNTAGNISDALVMQMNFWGVFGDGGKKHPLFSMKCTTRDIPFWHILKL